MYELRQSLFAFGGRRSVRRLHAADTHIPEQAQLALPAIEAPPPADALLRPLAEYEALVGGGW